MIGWCLWQAAVGVSHPPAQRFLETMAKPLSYPVEYFHKEKTSPEKGALW